MVVGSLPTGSFVSPPPSVRLSSRLFAQRDDKITQVDFGCFSVKLAPPVVVSKVARYITDWDFFLLDVLCCHKEPLSVCHTSQPVFQRSLTSLEKSVYYLIKAESTSVEVKG